MIVGLEDTSRNRPAPMHVMLMAVALVVGAGAGAALGLVDGETAMHDTEQFAAR